MALNNNSTLLNIGENPFKLKLKKHQLALLYKVIEIDRINRRTQNAYAVMSDKPGAGKTFVILAMIYFCKLFLDKNSCNLIIVPHNIYTQWINAIDKFVGNKLKCKFISTYDEINKLYTNQSILTQYDVIITMASIYDVLSKTMQSLNLYVDRIFFDEADTIKDMMQHKINTNMTWFVSASINNIFNSKTQTANIGGYSLPLKQLLINNCYCSPEFIDSNIKLPKPIENNLICHDLLIDKILQNLLNDEQINSIYSHDFNIIRNECGGKQAKNIIELLKLMYEHANKYGIDSIDIIKNYERELKFCKNKTDKVKIENSLNEVKSKTNLLKNRFDTINNFCNENNICINCFNKCKKSKEEFKNVITYYKTQCDDNICNICYDNLNEKYKNEMENNKLKCLKCNGIHSVSEYTENQHINNDEKIYYDKFKVLSKLINNVCNNKIIIYSKYIGLYQYIQIDSIENNYEYRELNLGNIRDLNEVLEDFKNNIKIKILLIDNSAFGVGLNIEYTTDIIFFQKIDNLTKQQLIGRAQRLGRTTPLYIWNLLYQKE
jgi:SNF2 family DNA or RNA helicase